MSQSISKVSSEYLQNVSLFRKPMNWFEGELLVGRSS